MTVRQAADLFDQIDLALVGIGSMEPSPFLISSGNAFSPAERREIRSEGAVGDLCLRFFDARGNAVNSDLNKRVIGIELDTLKKENAWLASQVDKRRYPQSSRLS